jgi:hypothetical protein
VIKVTRTNGVWRCESIYHYKPFVARFDDIIIEHLQGHASLDDEGAQAALAAVTKEVLDEVLDGDDINYEQFG